MMVWDINNLKDQQRESLGWLAINIQNNNAFDVQKEKLRNFEDWEVLKKRLITDSNRIARKRNNRGHICLQCIPNWTL